MKIYSYPEINIMRADLDDGHSYVTWSVGSHTANVYEISDNFSWSRNTDCFEFAHHRNVTSMLDFTSALEEYVS